VWTRDTIGLALKVCADTYKIYVVAYLLVVTFLITMVCFSIPFASMETAERTHVRLKLYEQ